MTERSEDRVRAELSSLAAEVTPVDLYPRVLRSSRRLYLRRVATAATAVAVTIVLAGAGAVGVGRLAGPDPTPPLNEGPTPRPPTASPVQPEREGSGPGPQPGGDPGPVTSLTPGPSVSGDPSLRFYFLHQADRDVLRLASWRPGAASPTTLRTWAGESPSSMELAPDRQRVAWITGRVLKLSRLDGSGERTVRSGLYDDANDQCFQPVWTADSKRILIRDGSGSIGYVDAGSGAFRALAGVAEGCHFRFSADGRWMVWLDRSEGRLVMSTPDGGQRRILNLDSDAGMLRLHYVDGLSADGRHLSVLAGLTGTSQGVRRVVDTGTGAAFRYLPESVGAAVFLSDGTLLQLTGSELILIDPGRTRLLWRGTLPSGYESASLLGAR